MTQKPYREKSGEQFSFKNESVSENKNLKSQQQDDCILKLQSQLDSDMVDIQKDLQTKSGHPKSGRSKLNSADSQQTERIRRYFRKQYEPFYFNNVQMKDLNFKQDGSISVKKYKGAFYLGQFNSQNQQKQGMGILLYPAKSISVYLSQPLSQIQFSRSYEGEFKADKRSGKGCETFPDGSVYKGDYFAGKPEGKGKFINPEGETYEGEWKDGIKNGKGFWKGVKGETYLGEWLEGRPQGYGVFVNQKGDRYEGEFKQFLKHGDGIQRFTNGDIYKGSYENGRPCGFGEYYWQNKSYFKGHFHNGLRCGQGLWKRGAGNCDKYEGQYQNDKKWGYGIFSWANGNVYKGNYSGDLRNGYGQMYWRNGCYYKGEWKDGVQNGQGQIFIVDQGLRKGLFENNEIIRIDFQELIQKEDQISEKEDQISEKDSDQENQQQQQAYGGQKASKKVLIRNPSKISCASSIKSKFSKVSKPITMIQRDSVVTQQPRFQTIKKQAKPQDAKQVELNSLYGKKQESRMKSVPLKRVYQAGQSFGQNNRYGKSSVKSNPFRIQVRTTSNYGRTVKNGSFGKIGSESFQGKALMSSDNFKKKDRVLHSSFYLYRFKNIGKPVHKKGTENASNTRPQINASHQNDFQTVNLYQRR